jgi:hypothetical protein
VTGPAEPPLTPAQERALESLRRDGLAMMPFSDLVGDKGLWAELAEETRAFASRAEDRVRERETERTIGTQKGRAKARKDDFIIRASEIQGPSPPPALLRYALSDHLLGISNAYLGLRSKLTYVDMWYTRPSADDADRVKSQRWHRDHIDPHIVKTFTYFSDVDRDAGALEYVRGSAPGGPYGHLWAASKADHYPPPGELERSVPSSASVRAEGPAGTIVICDTGGFHRGGFGRRPRITVNLTYVSPEAMMAGRTKRRFEVGEGLPRELSPAAEFAIA